MPHSVLSAILGRKLANREASGQSLGVWSGVAALGLDGLSSAAYGPEAALGVLAVAGPGGLAALPPITWAVLGLLGVLYLSYRQTTAAYPGDGGSYAVARENLGAFAGGLAAVSLMLDYVLNVAVGIAAGVGALTSALPVLHSLTVWLCLAILGLLTLINLRGTRESGLAFLLPTYAFLASLGGVVMWGVLRHATGHAAALSPPPSASPAMPATAVGAWLFLRALATGCSALTGVEAVSNGVSACAEPKVRTARRVLTVIVLALGLLLAGIAWLARHDRIMAMDQLRPGYQSVLAQLTAAVAGRGAVFYVTMASVLAVLCLSANTSFVSFPRLCRLVAADRYLPAGFAVPGRRLVYSGGVLFLAVVAAALLLGFGGITNRLIPLFAIGAFASFTLSQAGMAVHWWRAGPGAAHVARSGINLLGAVATAAALAVILVSRFAEGAWLAVIMVPAAVLLLRATHRYYASAEGQVLRGEDRRIDAAARQPPLVLLPIERWDNLSRRALAFAMSLSPDVVALHVTETAGPGAGEWMQGAEPDRLRGDWERFVADPARAAGRAPPTLVMEASAYRSVLAPLLRRILAWRAEQPGRAIAVVLPVLVEARWWQMLLHTHRERRLRRRLLRDAPEVMVVSVPWRLARLAPEAVLDEEEPAQGSVAAVTSVGELARPGEHQKHAQEGEPAGVGHGKPETEQRDEGQGG